MTRAGRIVFSIFAGCAAAGAIAAPVAADDTGFATTTHATRREGGKLCVLAHNHGGNGGGGTKGVALTMAVKAYYDSTASEYGSDWASWAKAGSKSVTYTKTADGFSAHIEGRPCK